MNRSLRLAFLTLVTTLAGALWADDPPADNPSSLRADNKQLTDELAAAWKEADKLKADLAAAQAASARSGADAADLRTQLDAAKAQPAAAAAPDATAQVADLQDKLATALRSFSVLQDENAGLKAANDKLASDGAALSQQLEAARGSISALQVQAAATAQIDPLRTQLRQAQDETGRLSLENEQLRNRLSLVSQGPGSLKPGPTRPGAGTDTLVPEAVAAPPLAPAAAPAAAGKTYVVADGDTLTRISRKFYGTSGRWEEILRANRDVMKNEKSLVVGSTIKIP